MSMATVMTWHDWLTLLWHFMQLSLLSVGGAISTTAELQRLLVQQHGWLTQAQFNDSLAIAKAAPGPNVLFVVQMGWNVGMNTGSWPAAALGAATAILGMLLPSSCLALGVSAWCRRNGERRGVRAFQLGMAPLVIALMVSAGLILAGAREADASAWPRLALSAVAALIILRIRVHMLWLLAAGALLGSLGIV